MAKFIITNYKRILESFLLHWWNIYILTIDKHIWFDLAKLIDETIEKIDGKNIGFWNAYLFGCSYMCIFFSTYEAFQFPTMTAYYNKML